MCRGNRSRVRAHAHRVRRRVPAAGTGFLPKDVNWFVGRRLAHAVRRGDRTTTRSSPLTSLPFGRTLRRTTIDDAATLLAWRNQPDIVALGKSKRVVGWDEHRDWLTRVLDRPDHLLLTVVVDGVPAGQIRFDPAEPKISEVSIYLLSQFRGRGLGARALREACTAAFASLDVDEIVAVVRADNEHSHLLFVKIGFREDSARSTNEFTRFQLPRPGVVPHNRLTFGPEEVDAVATAVASGQWTSGERVAELERRLAAGARVAHAVCVASGTSALRIALLGLGVGPRDRVFVPAYSCVALANAVLACGATPVPVDVESGCWQIDVDLVNALMPTVRPAACIVVNMFGAAAHVDRMAGWDIPVVEDCAHSFGVTVGGAPRGGLTAASVLSFHATKLIAAGEGGAILTNGQKLGAFAASWRDYADQGADGRRLNDQMTDIEASLAICQLDRLDDMLAARRRLATRYSDLLADYASQSKAIGLPEAVADRVWYRFVVEMRTIGASETVAYLQKRGIKAALPVESWVPDVEAYPVARRAFERLVSLPLYPTLTVLEQDRVIDALVDACEHVRTAALKESPESFQAPFGRVAEFYDGLVDRYGHDSRACDYGRPESQIIKFKVLSEVLHLSGRRVLDVGCGFADYAEYLAERFPNVTYTGADISIRMIAEARRLQPTLDLHHVNILERLPPGAFDVVTANGIFYLLGTNAEGLMRQLISAMYLAAGTAVAFNSLSAWAAVREPGEFYADPLRTLEYCRSLTPRVVCRHDYHDRDFTIYMYRNRPAS